MTQEEFDKVIDDMYKEFEHNLDIYYMELIRNSPNVVYPPVTPSKGGYDIFDIYKG